jgi:hypothetical protein
MLVHELVSDGAESTFARSWSIALGIDQAKQWQAVAQATALTLVMLILFEGVRIVSNSRWRVPALSHMLCVRLACTPACTSDVSSFEQHVDMLSVHATLFTGEATTRWQLVLTHLKFHSRVST